MRYTSIWLAALAALQGADAVQATQSVSPHLRVVYAVLEDDGDHDGWADTRETVSMRVAVRNLTGVDLTGLVLLVSTDDPEVEALTDNRIAFGDLVDGEMRLSEEAFEFVVADIDRTDTTQQLAVTFRFRSHADQYDLDALDNDVCDPGLFPQDCSVPTELALDLDLDASGGGAATTFFESFESGFGQFTTMHLDETLNPPPGDISNHALGVAAADGWRCQYADPDWVNARSFSTAQGTVCYPSPNGAPDTYYWHLAAERAFAGEQSLHFGVFLDPSMLYSSPTANLEAIRTTDPINLGWANVCSVSRTTFCSSEEDCPAGEECGPAAPTFTFKHQISLVDARALGDARSVNRGIVAVQLAAPTDGSPSGPWIRLEPYLNVYDTQAHTHFFNCTFDPADDGDTEEDFFDPTDPLRSIGPSSMCYPNYNFTFQGSTVLYDTSRLGKASDGPGILGAKGPGTWVEPSYDLSRFRGRRIRLRYMASGVKVGSTLLWHPSFVNNTAANPDPRDDGWFIDDARMTDVLTAPASVAQDAKDNSGLPGLDDPDADAAAFDNCPFDHNPDQADADGDGVGDACDDCPLDPYDDRYGAGACCPETAADDADGDALCGVADTCPGRFNPHGGAAFRLTPQASTFPPALITADGERVAYVASGSLYSVPLTGGAATLLHAPPAGRQVAEIGETPDGSTILFLADDQVLGSNDLYRVPVAGGAVEQLSAPLVPGGSLFEFVVSPDGARVVYWGDQDTNSEYELNSVGIGGGPVVQLNAPPVAGSISSTFAISPDGSTVVFRTFGPDDIWAVPILGGTPWRLNGAPVSGGGVQEFVISGDGAHVVYSADQEVDNRTELYVVPIGGGTAQKLNGPLPANGDVTSAFRTTPDGSQVVYVADENVDEVFELYRVAIDGTGRTRLTPGVSHLIDFVNRTTPRLSISPDGSRAVLMVLATPDPWGDRIAELRSVELSGGPLVQLDADAGGFQLTSDSSSVVYVDPLTGVSSVPIAGGPSTSVHAAVGPADGFSLSDLSPDSATVVFHSGNPVTGGLYAAPLAGDPDADGDGTFFPCDCDPADATVHPEAPEINDGQDNQCPGDLGAGLVDELIGETIVDASGTFTWPLQAGATMYEVARAEVPDFSVSCATWQTPDPWWVDGDSPTAGGAYYFLFRALAPNAGSWGVNSAAIERGPICP